MKFIVFMHIFSATSGFDGGPWTYSDDFPLSHIGRFKIPTPMMVRS